MNGRSWSSTPPPPGAVRLTALRGAYLLVGVGIAIVKWPLLAQAHQMPLYEGVTLCVLASISVLALLGVRYPLRLLPVLLLEILWKLLWLGLVALPQARDGSLDSETTRVLFSFAFLIPVVAAVPWRYVAGHVTEGSAPSVGSGAPS